MKSAQITFQLEAKLLDIVGEFKTVDLGDDDGENTATGATSMNESETMEPPSDQPSPPATSTKRSSPQGGRRRSSRLTQRS